MERKEETERGCINSGTYSKVKVEVLLTLYRMTWRQKGSSKRVLTCRESPGGFGTRTWVRRIGRAEEFCPLPDGGKSERDFRVPPGNGGRDRGYYIWGNFEDHTFTPLPSSPELKILTTGDKLRRASVFPPEERANFGQAAWPKGR